MIPFSCPVLIIRGASPWNRRSQRTRSKAAPRSIIDTVTSLDVTAGGSGEDYTPAYLNVPVTDRHAMCLVEECQVTRPGFHHPRVYWLSLSPPPYRNYGREQYAEHHPRTRHEPPHTCAGSKFPAASYEIMIQPASQRRFLLQISARKEKAPAEQQTSDFLRGSEVNDHY